MSGPLAGLLAGALSGEEAAARLGVSRAALARLVRAAAPGRPRLAPVSFDPAGGTFEMLDLARARFDLPFFEDSVAALGVAVDAPLRFPIDPAAMAAASRRVGADPAGFLFHSGRCGSTLLANSLAAGSRIVVLKEPGIVDDLLALHRRHRDPALARLIAAAIRLLAAAARPRKGAPVVLKLSAWTVACADLLLDCFPDAKAAFLYRAPEAVVASWRDSRPAWFDSALADPAGHALHFPGPAEARPGDGPCALLARAWRSMAESALAVDGARLRFLSYDEIARAPDRAAAAMARCFAGPNARVSRAAVRAEAGRYSKDGMKRAAFDPAGAHRRAPLSPEAARAVRAIAGAAYARLEAAPR